MILTGTFTDCNELYTYGVTINGGGSSITITDGTDGDSGVYFSTDPVHIACERTELTQLILISQATIKLKTKIDLSSLCADSDRDISVTITKNGTTIFFGYVDPLQFSQNFAYPVEEITITATDPLGALQSLNINQTELTATDTPSFTAAIQTILDKLFEDSSYTLSTSFPASIDPSSIKVNMTVFFGEDKDDNMTLYDTLNELLKYLGCTMSFNPNGNYVHVHNLYNASSAITSWFDNVVSGNSVTSTKYMDGSTSISLDDVYSQVTLTCDIEPTPDAIDLLDNDTLYSDYSAQQKYMTELISIQGGTDSLIGFFELLDSPDGDERATEYDKAYRIDHYCYVKRSNSWTFGGDNASSYITVMGGTDKNGITPMTGDQSYVLKWLKDNPCKAAFISFGKGNKLRRTDNSINKTPSLKDYFVISICGHDDHSTGSSSHNNTMCSLMESNSPLCTYNGVNSVNLTPTDSTAKNYIVISGKLILNPLQPKTGFTASDNKYEKSNNRYNELKNRLHNEGLFANRSIFSNLVPMSDGEAFYTQKWWGCSGDPKNPSYYLKNDASSVQYGLQGFMENTSLEELEYTYTAITENSSYSRSDEISKLPIIACQLKVGDKYCVERLDEGPDGYGVFKWMTMEQWEASQLYSKGYPMPYFTIGINPAIGDKIIGHSYSIEQNTSLFEGTAIPIETTDALNGTVEFKLLSPINQMWNEVEREHPSFWRHTSWYDHKYWVLEKVESILISDFKIEFQSDNGLYNADRTTADNDLVYASDTNIKYLEKLEEDIKICTPLTVEECQQNGIKYQISNSYIYTKNDDPELDNQPFYGWTVNDGTIKPEHLYVDYLYSQYSQPSRIISINVNNVDRYGSTYGVSSLMSDSYIASTIPGLSSDNYYIISTDWSLSTNQNSMQLRQRNEYSSPLISN